MPAGQMRGYLAGTAVLISQFDAFEVLAHIDCPLQPAGRFTELVRCAEGHDGSGQDGIQQDFVGHDRQPAPR